MAFTTIPGASATDATSFVGTDGVDVLATFSTLTAFVGAQEAADQITAGNIAGQKNWTTKGGSGNDAINYTTDMIGGQLNGNAGSDIITLTGATVEGAKVLGGQDVDTINTGSIANSSVNGNKGNDEINVSGFLLSASVFGGEGSDTVDVNGLFRNYQFSVIDGNLGNDVITLFGGDALAVVDDTTVLGGDGDDRVNATGVTGTGEGFIIDGGIGADVLRGSQRNDSISGGADNDTISGEAGADTLTGGAGIATFVARNSADTFTGTAAEPTATDVITDWKADTSALALPNNGDFLGVSAAAFAGGFDGAAGTVATLKAAMALTNVGAGVTVVGVGTAAAGFTSYALIYDNAGAADGVVQLGGSKAYTAANYANTITGKQIVDGATVFLG